jgi:hypothetical protein
MTEKRQELSIVDQWVSQSGQVSRSTKRLIEEFFNQITRQLETQ